MIFVEQLLAATIMAGTTLLFAAIGEIFAERSGVMNLGVEGMVRVGAVAGYMAAQSTGSLMLGILAALLAGGLMAPIHALLTVTLKASQVVSGLALTMFGTGLSAFLGNPYIGSVPVITFSSFPIPLLSDIPFIGPILFNHNILVYISFLLVPLSWWWIYKTRQGMRLRAVGENPAAADAAGINVFAIRYGYTIFGGMLAGLAGAYLSLAYQMSWMENISGGKGWIAVALVIFATWKPARAMLGAYLFGAISILGLRLQANGISVPIQFFEMLPYAATILVLILVTGRRRRINRSAPAALGTAYDREER